MTRLKSYCCSVLPVLAILLSFSGIVRCGVFDDQATVRKARCYAHCLTLYHPGSPDVGCHSDQCRQCGSACEMVSSALEKCNTSCKNSSICQQSCNYIVTINKWPNVYNGDSTIIQKPPAPNVNDKNLTSLTLSWQPGVQNVSGRVVYLLKKKFVRDGSTDKAKYAMVFTEPNATLTIKQVCESVESSSSSFPKPVHFYFIVVALTENSTLVEGPQSEAIEMTKPSPVFNISIPVFTYEKNSSKDKLVLTTSITPKPDQIKIITSYGMRWQVKDRECQGDPGVRPKNALGITDYSKISMRLSGHLNLFAECEHQLEVECVTSTIKSLSYKYPGCYNIPSFDKIRCYNFNPPPTSESSRSVRNLTHTDLRTEADFRFQSNVTWLAPTYPYAGIAYYSFNYGDITKANSFGKWAAENKLTFTGLSYQLTKLQLNVEYKVQVKPNFKNGDIALPKKKEFTFKTPNLPLKKLIVQNVQVRSLGLDPPYYSYNITWDRQLFKYGTFKGFNFKFTNGNNTQINFTNIPFFIIDGIRHSESRTFEIKPIYKESWIDGVTYRNVIKAPDPVEEQLKVGSLLEGNGVEDKENNTYTYVISWKAPTFPYKMVDHYQVSYTLSGYTEFTVTCDVNVNDDRCWPGITKNTSYTLTRILPRERIDFTVKPMFLDSPYFKGLPKTIIFYASFPRRDLVEVRNLTHNANLQINDTVMNGFDWEPPLFKHSAVKHYDLKYNIKRLDDTSANRVVRRSAQNNETGTVFQTSVTATTFSLQELNNGEKLTFQVTPVFKSKLIVGEKKEIVFSKTFLSKPKNAGLSSAEKAGLVIGLLVLFLLVIILIVWFVKRRLLVGANGAMIDQWEVAIDKIYLEDELGEGAFGKVFKGMLVELPEQSANYSIAKSIRKKSTKPLDPEDVYVVAIKMLQDFADTEQRREFLKEIQLMKDVGSHRNIVNMLGCGTVSEPMFLIVEYLPNGDLLHYLRKRRGKAMQYPDSDPRGPYHSTYCQTYFNKNNPDGEISLQQSRSDRVYVQTPEPQKESKNGEIQLISMKKNVDDETQQGIDNSTMEQSQADNNPEHEMKEEEEDDILTSGDLMAFAWQVSQGMEYLSKRGYVHRDLAARNVLVGINKEAKVADFGLTRHMYEDLYQAKSNRKLPLKWMSVEAIFDQSFTSQSDVWAYGVFLWELVTLGGTPYPSITNRELLKLLKDGYRMEKPETCDEEVYNIMCECWREKPEDRPTFIDLREKLEEMMTKDNPYLDLTIVDESRDYYNSPSFNSAPEEDDNITELIIGEVPKPRDEVIEIVDTNKNTISTPEVVDNKKSFEEKSREDNSTCDNGSFYAKKSELDLDQVQFDNDKADNPTRSKNDQKSLKYTIPDFEGIEL